MDKFERYLEFLLIENKKYNLTAITEPAEIRAKHFEDSLLLLDAVELQQGATLIDIGSGAGFPGVPLAIARPDLRVTLLESSAKKAGFLAALGKELQVPVEVINERAEAAAHKPQLRGQFDWVTARAVAALPILCELCLPFCKVGGCFAAYKGTEERTKLEFETMKGAMQKLGAKPRDIIAKETGFGQRTLVIVEKIAQTPMNYPRNFSGMIKKPL